MVTIQKNNKITYTMSVMAKVRMIFEKNHLKFWIKTSIVYGLIALSFSFLGFMFDDEVTKDVRVGQQILESASFDHVLGHIAFGMIIAIPTFLLRYIISGGLFAIALDADHLVQFFGIEMISRMGHSITFSLCAVIIMMLVFGRRDYLLGVISFAAVFSHIAWDIFLGHGAMFPILFPFYPEPIVFGEYAWSIILISAITIVFSIKLIDNRLKKFQK